MIQCTATDRLRVPLPTLAVSLQQVVSGQGLWTALFLDSAGCEHYDQQSLDSEGWQLLPA